VALAASRRLPIITRLNGSPAAQSRGGKVVPIRYLFALASRISAVRRDFMWWSHYPHMAKVTQRDLYGNSAAYLTSVIVRSPRRKRLTEEENPFKVVILP
jgi:hypothetical protein